jgi:hypothetical protein
MLIEDELTRHNYWLWPAYVYDRWRSIMSTPFVTRGIGLFGLGLCALAVKQWYSVGSFSDLGPELVAPVLLLMLSGAKHRR